MHQVKNAVEFSRKHALKNVFQWRFLRKNSCTLDGFRLKCRWYRVDDLPSVIVAKKPQFGILEARSNPQVCIQDAWGRFCCYKNQEKTFFHLSPLPCSIPLCARCPIPAKEAKPLSMFLVMVLVLIRGSVMWSVFGSNVNKLGMTWYSNIGKLCCKFVQHFFHWVL